MQTAIGIVSVDNYDDVTDTMDEKEISYLNSFITTMVSDWMDQYKVFISESTQNVIFSLPNGKIFKMMDEKFSILDTIRKESANHEVAITLSMGIAYGANLRSNRDHGSNKPRYSFSTWRRSSGKRSQMKRSRYFW